MGIISVRSGIKRGSGHTLVGLRAFSGVKRLNIATLLNSWIDTSLLNVVGIQSLFLLRSDIAAHDKDDARHENDQDNHKGEQRPGEV